MQGKPHGGLGLDSGEVTRFHLVAPTFVSFPSGESPTGWNCSPLVCFPLAFQIIGSLPSLFSFLVLWFLPLAMISGSWLGSAKATAVPWGFPGASALEPHAHPLPLDLLTQWHPVLIPWHGRYYPMKSVLYIFFTIGHTYTDMYIYLYKIYLS